MASDTWIDHTLSQRVHEAVGFEVVDRCVHIRKRYRKRTAEQTSASQDNARRPDGS
jgi:hypothetical protein